jgi:hypothetical protein
MTTTKSAWFRCGELEESYPEAHKAFQEEFACSIEFVDFEARQDGSLWAHVRDEAPYKWQGGHWVDLSPS